MSTIADPVCCGFAKVGVYSTSTEGNNRYCFELFEEVFGFEVEYDWYRRNILKAKALFQCLGKKSALEKAEVLRVFSVENWKALDDRERRKHALFKCRECLKKDKYRCVLGKFPIGKKDMKGQKKGKEFWFT